MRTLPQNSGAVNREGACEHHLRQTWRDCAADHRYCTSVRNTVTNMRTLSIAGCCLCLVFLAAIVPAEADTGSLYVAPGPSTVISADITRRNQEQLGGTGRKLGDIIGSSLQSKTNHATDLVVTTQCGHYKSATITYSDGSAKTLNLSNAPATQKDMDQAKAAIPILRIVDLPGCD
jgi:hypothetical protein